MKSVTHADSFFVSELALDGENAFLMPVQTHQLEGPGEVAISGRCPAFSEPHVWTSTGAVSKLVLSNEQVN